MPANRLGATSSVPALRLLAAATFLLASCGVAAAADAGSAGTRVRVHPTAFRLPPAFSDRADVRAAARTRSAHRATATAVGKPHHVPGQPAAVMFIGDSVAQTAAVGLVAAAPAYGGVIANEGIMGCGVVTDGPYHYFGAEYPTVLPQCTTWVDTWRAAVARDNPDVAAIVVGRWELMDRFWDGRWTHIGDPAYDTYLVTLFDRAVRIAASHGARVALLTSPYYLRGHRPDGGIWPEDDPARVDLLNGLLRLVAARYPAYVTVVDFGGRLSPGGRMAMAIDGVPVRSDGVHLTPQAGAWLAPWLLPQLVGLGRAA